MQITARGRNFLLPNQSLKGGVNPDRGTGGELNLRVTDRLQFHKLAYQVAGLNSELTDQQKQAQTIKTLRMKEELSIC